MSLQRKFLRALGIDDDKAEEIISAHVETVDALKNEIARYKEQADKVMDLESEKTTLENENKTLKDQLEEAKQNGAITIGITNHKKSPMVAFCDICLFTNAQETKYSILGMTSRIAQLAIIDTLYTYIVLHGGESVSSAVRHTESALESKKY